MFDRFGAEMARVLLLSSTIGLFADSCWLKIMAAQMISLIFLVTFLLNRPYRRSSHHFLQVLAMLSPMVSCTWAAAGGWQKDHELAFPLERNLPPDGHALVALHVALLAAPVCVALFTLASTVVVWAGMKRLKKEAARAQDRQGEGDELAAAMSDDQDLSLPSKLLGLDRTSKPLLWWRSADKPLKKVVNEAGGEKKKKEEKLPSSWSSWSSSSSSTPDDNAPPTASACKTDEEDVEDIIEREVQKRLKDRVPAPIHAVQSRDLTPGTKKQLKLQTIAKIHMWATRAKRNSSSKIFFGPREAAESSINDEDVGEAGEEGRSTGSRTQRKPKNRKLSQLTAEQRKSMHRLLKQMGDERIKNPKRRRMKRSQGTARRSTVTGPKSRAKGGNKNGERRRRKHKRHKSKRSKNEKEKLQLQRRRSMKAAMEALKEEDDEEEGADEAV